MYDIIGDIHGQYQELILLLENMGYTAFDNHYKHSEGRKVIFVGDYIDRGPQIVETLNLVKAMVDNGHAIALMGNHEYNAILFQTLDAKNGGYLRKHKIKNIVQHYETLLQFKGKDEAYNAYIEWFMTLPLFYENDFFRVVHACWDDACIDYLKQELGGALLNHAFLPQSALEESQAYIALCDTIKGKETTLPEGMFFMDNDGFKRQEVRVCWWHNASQLTWKEYALVPQPNNLPTTLVETPAYHYPPQAKPVFFGHYWMKGTPELLTANTCCLDYSVAKGDKLVAYRWHGEAILNSDNLVWIEVKKS